MKKYLGLIFCLFLHCSLMAQASFTKLEIYQSFEERTYTSAGLYAKHLNLQKDSVSTVSVSKQQLGVLNAILKTAATAEYFPDRRDISSAITFAVAEQENEKIKLVFTSSRVMVDLSNRRKYYIREEKDREFLRKLILSIKSKPKSAA